MLKLHTSITNPLKWAKESLTESPKEAFIESLQERINAITHNTKNPSEYQRGCVDTLLSIRILLQENTYEFERVPRSWKLLKQACRHFYYMVIERLKEYKK